MHLRDMTDDLEAFCDVYGKREYRLPDDLDGAVVIDVGAHVGSFAMRCLVDNAAEVICFEPDARSYAMLLMNLHPYRELTKVHNLAVWRSDGKGDPPRMVFRDQPTHSHAFGPAEAAVVPHIGLDAVLARHPDATILKLDCEGGEYPILATCTRLKQLKHIVGELHPMFPLAAASVGAEPTEAWLRGRLERDGFRVRIAPNGGNFLFFAERL